MSPAKELNLLGGIKARNIADVDRNFQCERCQLVLLRPVQLYCCGARLCFWCSKVGVPNTRPFVCPFCHAESREKQRHHSRNIKLKPDRGKQRELDAISLHCYKCSWIGFYPAYLQHLQQRHAHLECPDCHQHFYAINLFEEHREEACPDRLIPCSLPGCAQSIKQSKMVDHSCSEEHQRRLLLHLINCTRQRTKEHKEMVAMLRNDLAKSALTIATVTDSATRLRSTSQALQSSMNGVRQQLQAQVESSALIDESIQRNSQTQAEMAKTLQQMYEALTVEQVLYLNESGLIVLPFDTLGSAYSPKFRTNPHGYAFVVHVDNVSDAAGADERWLSVFICLMQTEIDPILVFPVPHDIHLCLYDQSSERKHVCAVIKADDHVAALSCPTTERNDEVGIVKFCPLTHLTDSTYRYRVDGRYFIGVYVDFLCEESQPFSTMYHLMSDYRPP